MANKYFISIKTKMIFGFSVLFSALIIFISIIVLFGVPFFKYNGEIKDRQINELKNLNRIADLKKSDIVQRINNIREDTRDLFNNKTLSMQVSQATQSLSNPDLTDKEHINEKLRAMNKTGQYRLIDDYLSAFRETRNIVYKDIDIFDIKNGIILFSTNIENVGSRKYGKDFVSYAKKRLLTSSFYLDRTDNGNKMQLYSFMQAASVGNSYGNGNNPNVVIILKINIGDLISDNGNMRLEDEKSYETVFTINDRILSAPLHGIITKDMPLPLQDMHSSPYKLAYGGGEGTIVDKNNGGSGILAAFRHIRVSQDVGFGLVVKKEMSAVIAPIELLVKQIIAFSVLSIMAVNIIIYILAKKITVPVVSLTQAAQSILKGDFNIRSSVKSHDELEILSSTFNLMLDFIENWHKELGNVVEERTKELNVANQVLHEEIDERKQKEDELKKMQDDLRELNREMEDKIINEIEQRRVQEQMLIQQSKMAATGQMIAIIAHQWKQPLSAISVTTQDIQDAYEYGELNREYIDKMVSIILERIDFMAKTIDDFRNFLKPSKEKVEFDVKTAIEEILSMFEDMMNKSGVMVSLEKDVFTETYKINGYPNEFKHVILNLLNNAMDAIISTHKKGFLGTDTEGTHTEGRITIGLAKEDGKVAVTIRDHGGGIPYEILGKIFEPYFTTKSSDKGTGIGLYMSKTIIENNMGGKLTARNLEDGSEFKIEI
ncbi:MAG: HAMP domain-containing protein [Nitrospirae bacterium]|nr:HAMP domain-containing protein [Nitrospirota bacterium]